MWPRPPRARRAPHVAPDHDPDEDVSVDASTSISGDGRGSGSGKGSGRGRGSGSENSSTSSSATSEESGQGRGRGRANGKGGRGGPRDPGPGRGGKGGGGNPFGEAEHVVVLECGGIIAYYPASANFVAYCGSDDHNDHAVGCRRVRTCTAGRSRAQGRPLGLLAAWLEYLAISREAHMAAPAFSHAERAAARNRLRDNPDAVDLFACERPARDDSDSEPEGNA